MTALKRVAMAQDMSNRESVHDTLVCFVDQEHKGMDVTDALVSKAFDLMPFHLIHDMEEWGADTEVRNALYRWLESNFDTLLED